VSYFAGKSVLVTGASGFLGSKLLARLGESGATVVGTCRSLVPGEIIPCDLTSPLEVWRLFRVRRWDCVFHCAGENGGLGTNLERPADLFFSNTSCALNVVKEAAESGVKKFVGVVASCAYWDEPCADWYRDALGERMRHPEEGILKEYSFLSGPPHPSVAGHAYAKRNLQLACSLYHKQYGLSAVCVCPATLYGPGQSYDDSKTKVVAALVKKFCDAAEKGEKEVVCWGSGKPLREVMYADDCVELLLKTFSSYRDPDVPLNLGTGQELSVKELAQLVANAAGYTGSISWDTSKPDGQFRKRLDLARMKALVANFEATPLNEGLARAVADYRTRRKA
jgi:GDP-L-fucose synthase